MTPSRPAFSSRVCPGTCLSSLAVLGWGFAAAHVYVEDWTLGGWLEAFILASLAATLVHTALDLGDAPLSRESRWWVFRTTVAGAFAFALLALAVTLVWMLEANPPPDAWFVLAVSGVVGASITSRAALYAARANEELDRASELAKLLGITQRVLRHNLRNELTVVLGHLDNVVDEHGESEDTRRMREHANDLIETGDQARRLVSAWEHEDYRVFDVSAVAADRVAALRERHPDVDVSLSTPEACRAAGHLLFPEAVEEALSNAVEHTDPDVDIDVTVDALDDGAELRVADTGPGVPEIERTAIFGDGEDSLSHSRGLGLWFVYWIARKSGGELSLSENDPTGTVVHIRLPGPDAAGD